MSGEFVDSNVHVYSADSSSGRKHTMAVELVDRLFRGNCGGTSIQVLCEFYNVTTRKITRPLSMDDALKVINNLSRWQTHEPNAANVASAIRRANRLKISFWDAMIIESAAALGCATLWSEDLQHGTVYDRVKVLNPFVTLNAQRSTLNIQGKR